MITEKKFGLVMSQQLFDTVEKAAAKQEISIAQFMRQAIKEKLKKDE